MIGFEGVYKRYGAVRILEGTSLHVADGKSLCLFGKSGCGKSTALKIAALITRPDEGSVNIDGKDVTKMSDIEIDNTRREMIAYTFQEPLLIPYVTALENVTLLTNTPRQRAVDLMTKLGLRDRVSHRPTKLSGGEKKRVDVARAILKNCKILIADEPLSNLDPESGSVVMELLRERKDRGGILIYSSVEPSEARYADDAIEMRRT